MPRRRWRLKGRREPLSPATRVYLELGLGGVMAMHPHPPGYEDAVYFGGRHALLAAWREYGEEILAAWVLEHAGSRPWSWWNYAATEPRACLEGAEYLYRGPTPESGDWIWKKDFGIPGCPQVRKPGAKPARLLFESEAAYLQRLSLLLPGEAERLSEAALAPEIVAIPELPELAGPARRPAPAVRAGVDERRAPEAGGMKHDESRPTTWWRTTASPQRDLGSSSAPGWRSSNFDRGGHDGND